MSTPIPTFQGEVQLRRWSESSTQGVQVTFALADSDELGPLKGLSGKRFMAVLVQIGDDEQPIPPGPGQLGPLAYWLVLRCNEPEFWAFLAAEVVPGQVVNNSEQAGRIVKSLLGVQSRKGVDGSKIAETRCATLLRGPYSRWLLRRGVTA
jgi:hypothetical protein